MSGRRRVHVLRLAVLLAAAPELAGAQPSEPDQVSPADPAVSLEVEEAVPEPPRAELPTYSARFDVTLVPSERAARVTLGLGDSGGAVKSLRLRIDPARHTDFRGDGQVSESEEDLLWEPPAGGGSLHYVVHLDHLRDGRSYDARCARRWAVLRGEDLVPRARVRTAPLMRSRSRLRLRLPEGWSAALPYPRASNGEYRIDDPRRRFDSPKGWFAFGELGVLRESIAGVQVAVAGPTRHGLRRHDILALLTWTLPTVGELFDLPDRLLVVGAGDPMWRGGLSGPGSVFIHADRPLISEDETSPILHELIHSLMRAVAGSGGDWITEGLAELYSLEVLHRSGTLSDERYQRAIEGIEKLATQGGKLRVRSVSPETRAKGIVVLRKLDAKIREATNDERSLDEVVRLLAADKESITTSRFRAYAEQVAGVSLEDFFALHAPTPRPKST